jgi:hypothetical protein
VASGTTPMRTTFDVADGSGRTPRKPLRLISSLRTLAGPLLVPRATVLITPWPAPFQVHFHPSFASTLPYPLPPWGPPSPPMEEGGFPGLVPGPEVILEHGALKGRDDD